MRFLLYLAYISCVSCAPCIRNTIHEKVRHVKKWQKVLKTGYVIKCPHLYDVSLPLLSTKYACQNNLQEISTTLEVDVETCKKQRQKKVWDCYVRARQKMLKKAKRGRGRVLPSSHQTLVLAYHLWCRWRSYCHDLSINHILRSSRSAIFIVHFMHIFFNSLVCPLLESTSNKRQVQYTGKYVNNYVQNADGCLCERILKKQVYFHP